MGKSIDLSDKNFTDEMLSKILVKEIKNESKDGFGSSDKKE